ncbi:CmcJ/NvfI family oxidoreductase, partial [Klebsiella pneumoniae]
EAVALSRGRYLIVNVWRPIRGPLQDMPLALCDARSVATGDLAAAALVYPDRTGETYAVHYNPDHRWYYAPEMGAHEAWIFKCFDSDRANPARFAPH